MKRRNWTSIIAAVSIVACAIICLQVVFYARYLAHDVQLLNNGALSEEARTYLLLFLTDICAEALIAICFIAFTVKTWTEHSPFGKAQSALFFAIACLLSAETVISVLWPTFRLPFDAETMSAELIYPELDMRLLLFALIFFALAAIFEYGRALKEDSDNIL